jgi:hypothetical protein
MWHLTLRKEHKSKVFGDKVLKGIFNLKGMKKMDNLDIK